MGFASWQRYCTASSSGRQPEFAALNRGRHLRSAGRPSRLALAHILVSSGMATDLRNVYEKYLFHGPFSLNLKTCLHESVGNHTVVNLIMETHFVANCNVCDFSFI